MASWIIYFRIADGIIANLPEYYDISYLIVGNIVSDWGIPCCDGYDSLSQVTRFKRGKI